MYAPAEWKVLGFLLDHPHERFGLYLLAQETGLSHTWIYRLIKKLQKENLIVFKEKAVQINLHEEKTAKLKIYFDNEVISLSPLAEKIFLLERRIKDIYKGYLLSLCLIGSAVSQTEPADLDFLIITTKSFRFKLESLVLYEKINLIEMTEKEFKEKYLETDDFIISSLASQRIIFDKEFIIRFIRRPLPFPEKRIIEERIGQLLKIRERLLVSLSIADQKNIQENLLSLLIQLSRIKLLKAGILPLSKAELPSQIKEVDKKICNDLTAIIKKDVLFSKIKKLAEDYAKQNLRSV